jgi:hypothetical protein
MYKTADLTLSVFSECRLSMPAAGTDNVLCEHNHEVLGDVNCEIAAWEVQ